MRAVPYLRGPTCMALLLPLALAWLGERVTIHALGTGGSRATGEVRDVQLLGHKGKLRSADGLTVELPCDHACALRISGRKLHGAGKGSPS